MRERGANSHPGGVASSSLGATTTTTSSATSQQQTNAAVPSPASVHISGQYSNDSDEYDNESDWDVGVGNLVIDLDADLEKCKTQTSGGGLASGASTSETIPPSSLALTTMSNVEHQATDHKGLKMKIKRKNVHGSNVKTTDGSKHEIVKDGKNNVNNIAAPPQDGIAGLPNDKVKRPAADKVKGRGVHKKVKDRSKLGSSGEASISNGSSNNVSVVGFNMTPASVTTPSGGAISTSNSGGAPTHNPSLVQAAAAGITGNVSVELARIATPPYTPPVTTPTTTATPGVKNKDTSNMSHDPYEFNAKLEDRLLGFPHKKVKVDKIETASSPITTVPEMHDVAVETCSVGVVTDPDCLGPCEPGTSVTLEGIVWQETDGGMLVVNVTWRGKTFVGTLLDATTHDFAPPRLRCDSPASDAESRTPKGRGKRRVATQNMSLNENLLGESRKLRKGRSSGRTGNFAAPASPAKVDGNASLKRKGRTEAEFNLENSKGNKRCRTTSNSNSNSSSNSKQSSSGRESPTLIMCPEPNCNKKYRHVNGLRYHQSHAHNTPDGADENDEGSEESGPQSPAASTSVLGKRRKDKDEDEEEDIEDEDEDDISDTPTPSPRVKDENPATPATPVKEKAKPDTNDTNRKDTVDLSKKVESSNPVTKIVQVQAETKAIVCSSNQVIQILNPAAVSVVTSHTGNQIVGQALTVTNPIPVATSITTMPLTMTAAIPTAVVSVQDVKLDKDSDRKKKGCEKVQAKPVTIARPIVPIHTPAAITVGPTIASLTQMAPVTTMSTVSGLKPIQPKPTIMGETSAVNPALASLVREKKKKKKKDSQQVSPLGGSVVKEEPRDGANSVTTQSVIKTSASPLKAVVAPVTGDMHERTRESSRLPDLNKTKVPSEIKSEPKFDQHVPVSKPNSLNLNSPLAVATESQEHNDDVQSPAYSDISDESAPTLEIESQKSRDDIKTEAANKNMTMLNKGVESTTEHSMAAKYMYTSYYAQPPYLLPAVGPTSTASPSPSGSSRNTTPKPEIEIKSEGGHKPDGSATPDKDAAGAGVKLGADYQLQSQKWLPYAQYQPYYGIPVDAAYYMSQQNEEQKRRAAEEAQKRDGADANRASKDSAPPGADGSRAPPAQGMPLPLKGFPPMDKSGTPQKQLPPALISEKERRMREQDAHLKEKQNENRQILKENIELKQQMDARRHSEGERRPGDPEQRHPDADRRQEYELYQRQQQDLKRYYNAMYQQQQMKVEGARHEEDRKCATIDARQLDLVHQNDPRVPRHPDVTRHHDASRHPDMAAQRPDHRPLDIRVDHRPPGTPSKDGDKSMHKYPDDKLRDGSRSRDSSETRPKDGDVKRVDKLKDGDDRMVAPVSPSPRLTPKPKDGPLPRPPSSSSIASTQPHQTPPSSSAYAQFYPHAYLQSPHLAQVPFDPSHPMYRGVSPIIGYPGPAYIHPAASPIRYINDPLADKQKLIPAGTPPPADKSLEILQPQYYGPSGQHKIHELQELAKSRDSSSNSPTKTSTGSTNDSRPPSTERSDGKARDFTRTPPPQRHLHTHHHTHVVGPPPGYPLYDPYGAAIMASQQAAAGVPAAIPHPFVPK